jgi:acyl dehydratase
MRTAESRDLGELSVGDESQPLVLSDVDRTDLVRYAGAAGDFNRLHHNEPYATEEGYPSVIAHGMLVAGLGATVVEDWFGIGAIEKYGSRFREMVYPGDTVTATATVTDVAETGGTVRVEADVAVENQDGDVVVSGWVTAAGAE